MQDPFKHLHLREWCLARVGGFNQCASPNRRTDAEAPILWPADAKNWLIRKDPDAGKGWGQEKKGTREGEMVGWDQQLDGPGFQQSPGVDDGQVSLACCNPFGRKQTWPSDWNNLNWTDIYPKIRYVH